MSDLGRALVDALDDQALEHLAERLGPRIAELVAERLQARNGHHYLNAAAAAEYLSCSRKRIWDLRSAGALEPDGYDGRYPLWTRETLDAYVRAGR